MVRMWDLTVLGQPDVDRPTVLYEKGSYGLTGKPFDV